MQTLVYFNSKKTLLPQIGRRYVTVSEYSFQIKHRDGDKMFDVDRFSLAPVEKASDNGMIENVYSKRINMFMIIPGKDRILMIHKNDEKLKYIVENLNKNDQDWTSKHR